MGHTALILGDQLMRDNPALEGADRVVFVESTAGMRRLRSHRRRVHLVLSGMRHFADELRSAGTVEVVERRGAASLAAGLEGLDDVVCAAPNSAGARRGLERLGVRQVASNQFLTDPDAFGDWAGGRKRLVMEDFYREQRRRFDVLLDANGEPEGGRWNFDADNRRPPVKDLRAPDPHRPREDAIDEQVRADLDALGLDLFGQDGPRQFAVTPAEAKRALASFVDDRLAGFGPWQDAMVEGERFLFHALLSVPLNLGVLDPLACVRAAERAYRDERAPLQSVEGFVRQVIGWREWVWGMYWLRAEQWPHRNALDARAPLGRAYAEAAPTGWNCLDAVTGGVAATGYAHHIERLMVLGTIGLTSGTEPWALVRWFQASFVDGAEWVMAPNAAGMALFADGGEMMTKPYAAGGNYINKMSDHCRGCRFSPSEKHGPKACPVTALYWDFVAGHEDVLGANRRTQRAVSTWRRFDDATRAAVSERAGVAREELVAGEPRWARDEELPVA
jgi:deoxyribodipyrimidine photolyase-related protein